MTQDDQTGDPQDGDTTTVDDSATTTSDSGSSADASTQDTSGGSGSDASSGGSGSSDTSSSDAGSSDASADSSSSGSGSGDGSSGSGDSASNDQTPAAELTVADIQPVSVDADSSASGSSGGADTASVGSTDAVAADAESGGGAGVSVGDLVTVGKAIASIMTASAPDYGMKSNPVSVLPQGTDPASMTGISSDPHELRIVVSMDNKLGMEMCNLPIVVQWRYGGSIAGKGHYITNASAFLDSGADIGAFYKGEVTAALQNPFNAGSDPKDMIASVDVHIEIKVTDKISPANLFIVLEGNIRGDGGGKLAQRP